MNDLQDSAKPVPKTQEVDDVDALLSGIIAGSKAPPQQAKSVAAGNELDDLLNDLDSGAKSAPPPKAAAPAPAPVVSQPPAPKPNAVQTDDLDDLLDGLDQPVKPASSFSGGGAAGGGGSNVDDLFGEINSSARSAGTGTRPTGTSAPVNTTPASGPSRGICAGCNQPVHGEVLQVLGKIWHTEHFCCGNCQQPLGTQPFFEYEGSPHCEKCYKGMFCPRCAKCDKPIMDRIITALSKKWHLDCFSCATCNQPFAGMYCEVVI